jgi:demethylmenaquinone methyltransferase / 2-methoxy-6-polyprenyl-1,4-benzoquinol methylase
LIGFHITIQSMSRDLPRPSEKRDYVKKMFGRIAARYDLLNKVISLGLDSSWRKRTIYLLRPEMKKLYLDIGCGTGDLAQEILAFQSNAFVIAADLTIQMIRVGKIKNNNPSISWVVADAESLPFPAKTFDGVVSGYLIRNVTNQGKALCEQKRVMHPGAKVVALDTTPPEQNWYYPLVIIYLRFIIPLIGKLVSGDQSAYSYLPVSTTNHVSAKILAEIFEENGFVSVGFIKLMLGTMAIHFGQKPVKDDGEFHK